MSVDTRSIGNWLRQRNAHDFAEAAAKAINTRTGLRLVAGEVKEVEISDYIGNRKPDARYLVELGSESGGIAGSVEVDIFGGAISSAIVRSRHADEDGVDIHFQRPTLTRYAGTAFDKLLAEREKRGISLPRFG